MLNTNDPVIKKFIADVHECIERRQKKLSDTSEYDREVTENRLFRLMCEDWTREPRRYAETLNREYGYNLLGDDIIDIFRKNHCTSPEKRNALFEASIVVAKTLVKAITTHAQVDYDNYMARRKNALQIESRSRINDRVICLMLFKKFPDLLTGNDGKTLERFGNVFMRYFLYDISDLVKTICLKPKSVGRGEKHDSKQEKIELLENMLNRSDMLLKDLQEEFDTRIKESHQDDLVEFFSRLNSDKYGCILDTVLGARAGIRQLRKSGKDTQLPPEISGLFILIEQLTNFIRDSEINPILKLGAVKDMRLDEVENCDYEGSPFLNAAEVKRIKVLSPGWVYKDKDVQIARPRLKEVVE